MFDFNDATPHTGPLGELIPDGTFCKLRMTIRPGGVNGNDPIDVGTLKAATTSDAKMLDCEFTVLSGPCDRRKFWQYFTVSGGKTDKNGVSIGWNISKDHFRAIIDSALALDPKDMSETAKQKRRIQGLSQLSGIEFAARVMVEPPSSAEYSEQNRLANAVLVTDPRYAAIMRGEAVEADPVKARAAKPKATAPAQAPGWQQNAPAQSAQTSTQPAAAASGPAWLQG